MYIAHCACLRFTFSLILFQNCVNFRLPYRNLLAGQFFAIKSKIKNIVFLINLKAKKMCLKGLKVLSRFKKLFTSKKSKNDFFGSKRLFFRSKKSKKPVFKSK